MKGNRNVEELTQIVNKKSSKEESNKKISRWLKWFIIITLIIIILLLLHRFIVFLNSENKIQIPNASGLDIFEIKCNDDCSCSGDNRFNHITRKLDNDSSINNIIISYGAINFNKSIYNYNILLETNIDKITLSAFKNSEKATLFYLYNKKIYNNFKDIPISIGENIITIVVIAESGDMSSYRVLISKLNENGDIVYPSVKDSNNNLIDIKVSSGSLNFEKNTNDYTIVVDSNIKNISIDGIKESEKATVTYIHNGKMYDEFKDIEILEESSVVTIVVTAEDGTAANYTVTINKKPLDITQIENLEWYSMNDLNIFSNPLYNGKEIISPGSSNSYEFIIKNKSNKKVSYQFEFKEKSKYEINMKYRLKRNGKYIVGNENKWVKFNELNDISVKEINYNKADDYVLDWKWFDGDNDNLIGQLQKDYTLSITLYAIIQE